MFNKKDRSKNQYMLDGSFARKGYDWWWHSLTARDSETGDEKAFFIEFFVVNPAMGGDEAILGQLEENKRKNIKPSYLMVKAGCWGEDAIQLHRFYGINKVKIKTGVPFSILADGCSLTETETEGIVSVSKEDCKAHPEWMCDYGEISWKLKIDKKIAYNVGYGASSLLRKIKAFEMYWHAEGMKTEYSGEIIFNGKRYDVIPEKSYGYADKNWGRGFTSPWVWLSSNNICSRFTGKRLKNTAFDIGGGKPKIYFLPLDRKLLGGIVYEGEEFEYNFSKFWTLPRTKFECLENDEQVLWRVWQENYKSVMKTEIICDKKDMILINYEAPDGSKRHNNLWNGGNGRGRIRLYRKTKGCLKLIDDLAVKNVGCEFGLYD